MWRGRQFLTIEEVVYLVDRGSLLLVGKRQRGDQDEPLSRRECYQIMVRLANACMSQRNHYVGTANRLRRYVSNEAVCVDLILQCKGSRCVAACAVR